MIKLLKVNGKCLLIGNQLVCKYQDARYEYSQIGDQLYLYNAPYRQSGSEVMII